MVRPMRGWVSGFILLALGAGLGLLGAAELGGAFAAEGEAASLAVLGAMIAFVPASLFAGLGMSALRRSMRLEREAVDALAAFRDDAPAMQAIVIPFPGRALHRT